jgi:hypothetical protein
MLSKKPTTLGTHQGTLESTYRFKPTIKNTQKIKKHLTSCLFNLGVYQVFFFSFNFRISLNA